MRVYRLERRGIGPFMGNTSYRYPKSDKKMKRRNHIRNQCKRVEINDFIYLHSKAVLGDYVFGARSKEMLKAYFCFNLKHYFDEGYRIKSYEVPDDKIIDMGNELAFPIEYHKFQSANKLRKEIPC